MAENIKYNIKDGLLHADETLMGSNSLMGMTALTPSLYINAMRGNMFTSHLKQFLTLRDPDFPGVFTNAENLVGKYSTGFKAAKHDLEVYKKIVKFDDITDKPTVYMLFVRDKETGEYDVIERKDSEDLTEVFGFEYNNEYIDSLDEGDEVPKGQKLFKSTSYDENDNYRYGKNLIVMYTNDPFTSEDAAVIRQGIQNQMESIEINQVTVGINDNDVLLNLYGGENGEYKPFPDIGEYTNGEICTRRTMFNDRLLSDFSDKALRMKNDADVSWYKKGKVIDISVYSNNPDLEENPFNKQILKYLKSEKRYYTKIRKTCQKIIDSGAKYSRDVDYLWERARIFLDNDLKWKDDTMFGGVHIIFTVKDIVTLQKGQKLTGQHIINITISAGVKPL